MNLFKKKKEPIKRRKRKKKIYIPKQVITYNKYALVDSKGKIVEKFRIYQLAKQMNGEYNNIWREKLNIVELDSKGKIKKKDGKV